MMNEAQTTNHNHPASIVIILADTLARQHGYWSEHPVYSSLHWRDEVLNEDTRLGYWLWVANLLIDEGAQ